ncbi:hypothetical protein MTR_3g040770 [Medicago truncatula]|uniref:Transmembrane protein n=1 Tax=Medicago truncatula TaxID=3880 RepID=A0A072UUJ5_MEDTR|nr:hypothetical protein MTR_3g040770 [Medicago truncatula]
MSMTRLRLLKLYFSVFLFTRHDYAKERRKHGVKFRSIMMESRPPHYVLRGQDGLKVTPKILSFLGHLKVIMPKRDYTRRYITFKRPPLSGVISHEPKHETTLRMTL